MTLTRLSVPTLDHRPGSRIALSLTYHEPVGASEVRNFQPM